MSKLTAGQAELLDSLRVGAVMAHKLKGKKVEAKNMYEFYKKRLQEILADPSLDTVIKDTLRAMSKNDIDLHYEACADIPKYLQAILDKNNLEKKYVKA